MSFCHFRPCEAQENFTHCQTLYLYCKNFVNYTEWTKINFVTILAYQEQQSGKECTPKFQKIHFLITFDQEVLRNIHFFAMISECQKFDTGIFRISVIDNWNSHFQIENKLRLQSRLYQLGFKLANVYLKLELWTQSAMSIDLFCMKYGHFWSIYS